MPTNEGMSLNKVLGFMEENKQLKVQVERLKDTLVTLNREFKKFADDNTGVKYDTE